MKKLLLLGALALAPLTSFAAIHNGRVIDGKAFVCRGKMTHTYPDQNSGGTKTVEQAFKYGQCVFTRNTLRVTTLYPVINNVTSYLYTMNLKRRVLAYSGDASSDRYEFNLIVDFGDNNFNQ